MLIIVGLGNPGKKYEKTRHNVGFRAVDEIAANFQYSKKFGAEISERVFDEEKIILAKPQTFMNNSGKSVKILNTKYKIPNTNLWVIHDDIDLPLDKIKIVKNRGAGGHKGVESIIKNLKSKNFVRFRLGIQPKNGKPPKQSLRDATGQTKNPDLFVLQKFTKNEEKTVKEMIEKTAEAVEMAAREGLEKTMSKYNK